jgi:hypothetical protein
METPGSPIPMLNWAVAAVTEPITNPNASSPLRSTSLICMLSVGHRYQDIPDKGLFKAVWQAASNRYLQARPVNSKFAG